MVSSGCSSTASKTRGSGRGGTQNDVMVGLVFFVPLLLPAAFFSERLLFSSAHIHRQLMLFALLIMWLGCRRRILQSAIAGGDQLEDACTQ
ncbi:MAG TPA: hypothetical protein EYQ31_11600 [Candidatus Handelsmanbacteria bacterium]|nr:hypothetical protein [Candidatus Handelsmanbacteria bacterium]